MNSNIKKTAEHWSEYTKMFAGRNTGLFWWDAGPEICKRINRKISGDPDCDYTTYTLHKYFRQVLPLSNCLSLGCGAGGLERSLARQGAFQHCDAYDIADGAIEEANHQALVEGFGNISYYVADVNYIILPANHYDSVWIQGAMHHFEALEHICAQIRQSLKLGGFLILNEYIGPKRFQFPDRQKEVANLCLQLLPKELRIVRPHALEIKLKCSPFRKNIRWAMSRIVDKIRDGDLLSAIQRQLHLHQGKLAKGIVKESIIFPSVRDVISTDSTEAIRSDEILTVLQQQFEIVEMKDLGGNILQFLLADIAGNFANSDHPKSQILLKMLMEIEEAFLYCNEFKSDFAYIVARPQKQDCLNLK